MQNLESLSYFKLRHVALGLIFAGVLNLSGCSHRDQSSEQLFVASMTCEFKASPQGVGTLHPRFGWKLESTARNQMQTAYRILVSDQPGQLANNTGNIWDSGKLESDNSIMVRYEGNDLQSGETYYWKVQVWSGNGTASEWSNPGSWQMALLSRDHWNDAQWIGYEELPDSLRLVPGNLGSQKFLGNKAKVRPVTPQFRKEFVVENPVEKATLFISGLGQYESYLNGKKIGDGFLTPGWTYYDRTVLYNVYDVTEHLQSGANALGVMVGNGFHNINRERYYKINVTFGMPKMIARLNIRYRDGSETEVVSGPDWSASSSAITFNSIFGGEDYDARLEQTGWNEPNFSDDHWKAALLVNEPLGELTPESDYSLKVLEELTATRVEKIKAGKYMYDFGQNASAIVEIKVKGIKGQEVRIIPGELINEDNTIIQNNDISGAPYYFSYILKGDEVEVWRPRFTYYGFRYAQVEGGVPSSFAKEGDLPELLEIKMLHTRNSSPEVGTFECSSDLMNKINSMTKWGIRSNMVSVLTDCPHREKLGWLEVTHLMGDAIHFNYDIFHFYSKVVDDMITSQTIEGMVPTIAPEFAYMDSYFGNYRDAPVWGSAAVVLPWLIYKWYGDTTVMKKAWPMMTSYVAYLRKRSDDHIVVHGLGDWCELNPDHAPRLTPTSFMGTAQYYYNLKLLTRMSDLLNLPEERQRYFLWSEDVRTAFQKEFFDKETGVYSTGSQAAFAFPLAVGLVDQEDRQRVLANLFQTIKDDSMKLTVGSAGIRYLVEVLMDDDNGQLLYDMNNRYDAGYGLQLASGATTLVEPWIPSKEHGSNNHPALGNLMRWFYEGLAGIDQEDDSYAYRNILIKPQYPVGISEAKATFESPFGQIRSEWRRNDDKLHLSVDIPVNTSARIFFPVADPQKILEDNVPLAETEGFEFLGTENGQTVFRAGSGTYSFDIELN